MMKNKLLLSLLIPLICMSACTNRKPVKQNLPILGKSRVEQKMIDGKVKIDTLFYTIPAFRFIDQDSNIITKKTFKGQVYIADFFFTTCPSICPKTRQQMKRIYDAFSDEPRLAFISHSIDPEYDTVAVLHDYAERLGISSARWHLVTGNIDSIYAIARDYQVSTRIDPEAPGGFNHSGAFVLIDTAGRIRGYYDGTSAEETDQLMQDLPLLFREMYGQ